MASPSPADSLNSVRERLGDLQALAASICQKSTSRLVSRVFAQVSNIIWKYYGESRTALQNTCTKCQEYLRRFDPDELTHAAPECAHEIWTAYDEIDALYSAVHS